MVVVGAPETFGAAVAVAAGEAIKTRAHGFALLLAAASRISIIALSVGSARLPGRRLRLVMTRKVPKKGKLTARFVRWPCLMVVGGWARESAHAPRLRTHRAPIEENDPEGNVFF